MIRLILVALDGSVRAANVFDVSIELARPLGARLVLYRGLIIPPDFTPPSARPHPDPLPAFLEEEAREQLLGHCKRAPDIHCELLIEPVIQPWRSIIAAGDAVGADLIVLGSHGYHGWDHVLGTTAAKVVNVSHRSVLVVHGATP